MSASAGPIIASVIIVNWNGKHHLEDCLNSLATQEYRNFETILVDNGSTDGSIEYIEAGFPWVKLLSLQGNTGFAEANNLGFELAGGEYIITLNNDTRVARDWLKTLVAVAEDNPSAGMIGSRICSYQDPDLLDSLGVKICADGMSRGAFRNARFSTLDLPETMEILLPSACAALYRREMIAETGFFDQDFFAYCEDTDLGLRGRWAGWEALLATGAVVYHKYSQTGGSFSPFKLYSVERNHYWVALKCFPLPWLLLLPLTTAARYLRQAFVVGKRSGAGRDFALTESKSAMLRALARGTLHAVAALGPLLRKRKQVMATRRLSTTEFRRLLRRYRLSFKELLR